MTKTVRQKRDRRKTDRGQFSSETMKKAVKDVLESGLTLREASRRYNLAFKTVSRYVNRQREAGDVEITMTPRYDHRTIFPEEVETQLVRFLRIRSEALCDVKVMQLREMAYKLGVEHNLNIPLTWHENKFAGKYWLQSFKARNPGIILRTPQRCSLARLAVYTKENVATFYSNLKSILEKYPQLARDGSRIFNLDEICVTTVVHAATAAESDAAVTVCCIICANGTFVPPVMVFPSEDFQDHMLTDPIPGTLGLATSDGSMNAELFLRVLEHFTQYTRSSKSNPTILILDNCESHVNIEALIFAKEHGINVLTLPPHCSEKLQPLDVAVFSSFKSAYNKAIKNWQVNNPLKVATIDNVSGFVKTAFMKAFTPTNVTVAFSKTGIYAFNDHAFNDFNFLEYFRKKCKGQPVIVNVLDTARPYEDESMSNRNTSSTSQRNETF